MNGGEGVLRGVWKFKNMFTKKGWIVTQSTYPQLVGLEVLFKL